MLVCDGSCSFVLSLVGYLDYDWVIKFFVLLVLILGVMVFNDMFLIYVLVEKFIIIIIKFGYFYINLLVNFDVCIYEYK